MRSVSSCFFLPLRSISFISFFERFIANKVCTERSRTNYKIVPLTNLEKNIYSLAKAK